MYPQVQLFIDGQWTAARSGRTLDVPNPATGEVIGTVAHAGVEDLDLALAAAERGLKAWRATPGLKRAEIMRKAGALLRERSAEIGRLMVLEQGKTLGEALGEVERGAEVCDWMAGETQRIYGRIIPGRSANVLQMAIKEPIGVVAAFTPWNFPINQLVRKVAGALAAGCALVVKGPEETPASCAELVRAYIDAGVPAGALNLVFGTPSEISNYVIPHPTVRKVSFTGSTAVGKQLASLAGLHMKPVTMELGGHAPVLVFDDADVVATAKALSGNKFRCTGQSCISPTRFLVQENVFEQFVDTFVSAASAITVGSGLDAKTVMGPLANPRRVESMEGLVKDAVEKGAELRTGGKRIGNVGNFFEPTVLARVPVTARAMNEEPFGPMALINSFGSMDEAVAEANRLPYGLAAFAFTSNSLRAREVYERVDSGMVSINHFGLGIPETPFGGIRESGYGFEGGAEAIEPYLQTRFVTLADL